MADATRAWSLVSAAKIYFDSNIRNAHEPIATIYRNDSRVGKNSSTAYLRVFRQSLTDNNVFAARLARTVQYDLGVVLAAMETDFPGGSVADNLEDVASDNTCAYVATIRQLQDRDRSVIDAFCVTQMMRAEQAGDVLLFAASLLYTDLSASWDCIQDKVKYFPEIIWVFRQRLSRTLDNNALLSEVKTLMLRAVDVPRHYQNLIADVCRDNGVKAPEYSDADPLDAEGLEQMHRTVQTYLVWVQNRHLPTRQDLGELMGLLRAISPGGSNFEDMIEVRYRYT